MKHVTLSSLYRIIFLVALGSVGWTQNAAAQSDKPAATPEEHGAALFKMRCRVCHDVYATGTKVFIAPRLNNLFKRQELLDGKPVNEENVAEVIKTGPTQG